MAPLTRTLLICITVVLLYKVLIRYPIYTADSPIESTIPPVNVFPLPPSEAWETLRGQRFPAKLWQKSSSEISERNQERIRSWRLHTPYLRHELLTDASADEYVRERYGAYPELVEIYLSLQVPILKADVLRQLILYADGGIWSDLDVTCHAAIERWIPEPYRNATNVLVGIEFDGEQFASWTVMAKPRSSHFAAVIRYIVAGLQESAAQYQTSISGLTMQTISDVVNVTGPQAMTVAILENLRLEMGEPVGFADLVNVTRPMLLQDVLVLPDAAFAASQAEWPKDRGEYLVEHHYEGSWKNEGGGYL
ncbi:hypothetical protein ASPZODRAFT_100364 [Penicilliopsis zonata CBS 506.65]|uniref:Initiation-specific alpha-1,6-mannosyltransferase n=1 Tax=Penicilliopsis zonata CBS 506.65 TaxID=1073090 RepID=A0A1L9SDD2_9EURO|nr:hypothetical protein ASPZODRAFT_100364 [Penicilliopsis zonata CBS 506.65]OJJ45148.1 hypothetical protein ASPZODRAFT_100364 [Penicilliopsis zonata CBS 506.65]